jgi:hypothetical protein
LTKLARVTPVWVRVLADMTRTTADATTADVNNRRGMYTPRATHGVANGFRLEKSA